MHKGLIVLLSLGVVVGFGSGFARLAHHGGGCHERWGSRYDGRDDGRDDGRSDGYGRFDRGPAPAPAPAAVAPAAAPVYIVIPLAAAQAPIVVNNAPPAVVA